MSFIRRDRSRLNLRTALAMSSAGQSSSSLDKGTGTPGKPGATSGKSSPQLHIQLSMPSPTALNFLRPPLGRSNTSGPESENRPPPITSDSPQPLPTNTDRVLPLGIDDVIEPASRRPMVRSATVGGLLLPSPSADDTGLGERPTPIRSSTEGTPQPSDAEKPNAPESEPSVAESGILEGYHGFHGFRGFQSINGNSDHNTPPLLQPIKPRFRKKGQSLLGKLIHLKKEPEEQENGGSAESSLAHGSISEASGPTQEPHSSAIRKLGSSASSSSKYKFRLPLISLSYAHHHPHHHYLHVPDLRHASVLEHSDRLRKALLLLLLNLNSISGQGDQGPKSGGFDLNLNMEELLLIVKQPGRSHPQHPLLLAGNLATDVTVPSDSSNLPEDGHKSLGWIAPESWDVTGDPPAQLAAPPPKNGATVDLRLVADEAAKEASSPTTGNGKSLPDQKQNEKVVVRDAQLPALYGALSSRTVAATKEAKPKGPNYIIRVFKEDNTFTTILCPLETTTAELLLIVQRKFFFESVSNYQILVYVGNNVKVLEPFEKPLKIQLGLLLLSDYTSSDNLNMIGREDLSFICKFVVENMLFRNLTHEEEVMLSKDYVDVNISSRNLKNIPIMFHQHTYEIEKLNVSDNPSIYIPLDFIQSCTTLWSISFARNGCSKFPLNFLDAHGLISLNLEANFLDELPARIDALSKLRDLRLNLNQLRSLPSLFGRLDNLVLLNLSSNYFQEYPEGINELSNLQELDISYNDFSTLPASMKKLVKLVKLNLCTNKLTGPLPSFFRVLTNLKRLDIRYNEITNVDVLGFLPNLEVLFASKNNISGFSDKMQSLRLLHFDRNPITSLQFEIILPQLTVLDLSKAKITSIPDEFISKIPHVEKLLLDKNHLVTLPDTLGNLPRLTTLSIFGNNIQHLPKSIGELHSLQYLDIHSNNLESIPSEIWNLKFLTVLNVSSNLLLTFPKPEGAVARKISSSQNLMIESSMTNSHRNMTGIEAVSSSLAESLLSLTLADNRLTDDVLESVALFSNLKYLNLSYNDLIEIPDGAMSNMRSLTDLYLSGNGLTKLPAEEFESLVSLRRLYANNNKLSTLPAEISKLKNLRHLDVGSNLLRYNISNWPYDWNWFWNQKLWYLNFSGNKRFEIKPSYLKNPESGEGFDSLLVLPELKVLGLIDVTLTTTSVPDLNRNVRVRTTSSEIPTVGYGVSDTMGVREHVLFRDIFIQKFRGHENEALVCTFDGYYQGNAKGGHLISSLAKTIFVPSFIAELARIKSDDEIPDALRRLFLSLNKEINSAFQAKKGGYFTPNNALPDVADLTLGDDALAGASMAVIYMKDSKIFCGNVGDTEVVLAKANGDYQILSTKHDPTNRVEFERIRASGGYVSGEGLLDGSLPVSRGVGYFNYVPHTHSGSSILQFNLSGSEDVIVMGSKVLWDFVSYDLAVDILREEKDDPMVAAQKLRDYAICYGASDKIAVTVLAIGEQRRKKKTSFYGNLGRESETFSGKKRRDRGGATGDTSLRRLEDEIDPPVGNIALVFTDIKNSTLLWDAYPVAMRSAIKLHNTIMRRQLRIVGGYEVKTEGDSFMVSFPTPTSALIWCFNVQNQLLNEDWPTEILETNECCEVTDIAGKVIFRGLSVRMGIHWGSPVCEQDMVTRRMDYFGPMVNRASRIELSADGGQIAVSWDFLHEMELLFQIHEQIISGQCSLQAAYEGNERAGDIIEREIASLDGIGCAYFELGERKLKGLEAPELITLAYPKSLEIRHEIFRKRLSQSADLTSRIVGALPVDLVYQLRVITHRLEKLCSMLNNGSKCEDSSKKFSNEALTAAAVAQGEEELGYRFFSAVTRVENCVANLELHQLMLLVQGNGKIDFHNGRPIWQFMDEVRQLAAAFGKQT